MEAVKIMMFALAAVLMCVYLKNIGSSLQLIISITVCVMIMMLVVVKLSSVIESINKFSEYLNYSSEYVSILLKTVIITYITSFTSDVCKDSGYNSIAGQVELFGKITIIVLSLPVIFELLDITVIQAFGEEMSDSLDDFDYSGIDSYLENNGISNLSFGDMVGKLLDGDFSFWDYFKSVLSDKLAVLNTYKSMFVNILLLAVFSGIFKALASRDSASSQETSRIITMINLVIILSKIFSDSLKVCGEALESTLSIYRAVMPVFLSAVAVITGSITYAAYYQVILICITVVNMIFSGFIIMLIKADYCLSIANRISQTDRFGKLVKFIEDGIKWTCRITVIAFTGIGCVKGIMAPMSDSFKRTIFYKSAKIIPGLGDSLEAVSSAVYGSGVIIKNGIGIGGIILIIMILGAPFIHISANFLLLKLASAVLQPMADSSFVNVIDDAAGAVGLMLLTVIVAGLLFIILTGLICAFTNTY